ncbi:MAG: winged helix-turn-helix domain-containing protein [Synechococcus sp. ELA057]
MTPAVLLVGGTAEALAPRLEISGYSTLAAADAVAGARPAGQLCAVILSPGEEGRIPALRQRWGAVPMLLGAEGDTVESRRLTLLHGADDFWLTTLGPSDLLTRLRLLRQQTQPPVSASQELVFADLRLIPASRQVWRGEREVLLTGREFQLLHLLVEHRGQVLSRELIQQQVWQEQQDSASNVIEVYVRYLRQKLEQGGERRLIHTVRGRGYCLSDGPAALS